MGSEITSEMDRLVHETDWSQTPVGPAHLWPQSLKTAVRIVLGSRYPMFLWWGREMTNFYNDAYAPILGRRHPQALGRSAPEIWTDIWDVVGPQAEAVLNEGQSSWNEDLLLVMERNGYTEETYFTFSYSPVANDEGGPGGVFCACTEETRRVLGARRLRTLRDLAETTARARTADDACRLSAEALGANPHDLPFALLYLFDSEGRARLAGAAGIEGGAPGAPRELPAGANARDSWPVGLVEERGEAVTLTDVAERFGTLACGPWPEPPHSAYLAPVVQSGGGAPAGVLVAGISARRELDDDYRGFLDLAAGHVATAVASARAYDEERRRAEALAEIDRAKTVFFSNVSHEFRTPLALMLGPLEDAVTAPAGTIPEEERERLAVARRNGERLLRLVNTLLDFSRIEAGRIEAAFEPVDLAAFTADLASVFRAAIERAGLRLVVDCPPLGEDVFVDREMWEKVVFNLLSNAFKFTFEGEIEVSLRRRRDAAELAVRDTGTGIPSEEMAHLFERFHRVKNARGRTFEGSGIGLALVRELARLHGGAVHVESEPGHGSTFRVSVPLGAAHLPADRVHSERSLSSTGVRGDAYVEEALLWLPDAPAGELPAATATAGAGTSDLRPGVPRVLVADDNADMRNYIRRLLSPVYHVTVVADGEAALEAAWERRPDLVLADVMMPKLDGLGLLASLRADERTASVPVILLSARAGEESRLEGFEAGADDYLTKPFSARELLARVDARLEIARVRRETERRILDVLETITDAFQAIGPDYRYVYANPAARRVWAYLGLEANVVGKHVFDEAFPESRDTEFGRSLVRAMTERVPVEIENFYEPFGRWYAARFFPTPDGGVSFFSADITGRKLAEEAVRQRTAQFETLLNEAPLGVYLVDGDFRLREVNPTARPVFGDIPDLVGRDFAEVIHILWPTTYADEVIARFRHTLETGEPYVTSERFEQRLDRGVIEYYEWQINRIPLPDGRFGVVCYFRDISEMERARRAIAESEERYRSLTQAMTAVVWETDAEGAIVAPQLAWERFTGQSWEQYRGWGWAEAAHPEDRGTVRALWSQALANRTPYRVKARVWFAEYGEYRHVEARAVPLFDVDGKVREWVGTVTDVHERTRSERERERLFARAQAARAEAEAANRLKDEFLATMSHELRTPLNSMLGWTRLLRAGQLDEPTAARALETIERNTLSQAKLIEDLLDVSRIITGKLLLSVQPVDLEAVVHAAVDSNRPAADSKGVRLDVALAPYPNTLFGDPERLQQVVWNLVSNAVKFTDRGGRVRVDLAQVDSHLELVVSDSGRGIAPEFIPHVFDRFRQADGGTTRRHGGLGLGLAIVRHIVELHGGSVAVDSPGVGMGTSFVVSLPLTGTRRDVEDRELAHATPARAARPLEAAPRVAGLRLLVVDDEADTRDLISHVFGDLGADVRTAGSVAEALAILDDANGWRPDALVSDIGLPGRDGYELIRAVRTHASPAVRGVPAVAVSAYARSEDRARALEAGFEQYVAKPVEPFELVVAVSSLARPRPREEAVDSR